MAFGAYLCINLEGQLDLIVTKSVSRFARNIVDCISMVRKLRALHPAVGVYFEAEHIFTLKNDTDMSLAFTATMAEEESHTKSTIMNMSVQMRFGLGKYLTPRLLGYTHDEDGHLIINEAEAPIVRLIFFMYLYGYTCQEIADQLTALQVKTRTGKDCWSNGTIVEVLRNERHCGDIRAGKTFTPDFHNHRAVKNRGERPIYGMYDHHEPIISRDDFIAVQQMLNNAKYGSKGILPELCVITEGALAGFVSINPKWAGFTVKDYIEASSTVSVLNVYQQALQHTVTAGEFDYRGYEVTRSQFFESQKKTCCTISPDGVVFMVDCIRKLNSPEKIEILIHPEKRMIAVRKALKETKNGSKWFVHCSDGRFCPRKIPFTACIKTIYAILGWDIKCSYRMCGSYYTKENIELILYNADDAEILLPNQVLLEEPAMDDALAKSDIAPFTVGCSRRVVAFPQEWANSFGKKVYAREDTNEQMWQSSDSMKISIAASPVSTTLRPSVTPQETLQTSINDIIRSIAQGDKQYVE